MNHSWRQSMRAAVTVAGVYGFFLIFAQFSFVELLRAGGVGRDLEKVVLGAMAVAGIGGGFYAAWKGVSARMATAAMAVAGLAAAFSPQFSGTAWWMCVAVGTGASLGVATVCLAALLPGWCGVFWVGLGTGLGYALCNVPGVFLQTAAVQSWVGLGFALMAILAMPTGGERREMALGGVLIFPFVGAMAAFTALVWLDSAAFFIIQHAVELKSGTWGASLLWRNAGVHLVAACMAGGIMLTGRARWLPVAALLPLAAAALAVNNGPGRPLAGWLYPVGVSLYSAALVAWPGWFSGVVGSRAAAWRAAWLFAIAGWFGSANGIGMAQSLARVPVGFVVVAAWIVGWVTMRSFPALRRASLGVTAVALAAWMGGMLQPSKVPIPEGLSPMGAQGRQVYLSEGCLNCHSQYVRPGSPDEKIWGPARPVAQVLAGEPVLIANRRQGPDLTHVGARRSAAWLKEHFINPQVLVPGSLMPSYAHLFEDRRGDELVTYLREIGAPAIPALMQTAADWKPTQWGSEVSNVNRGDALFSTHCIACHGSDGRGGGPLAKLLALPPSNLVDGPLIWTADGPDQELRTARIIKFGVIGMDMPGHEVMTDADVKALVMAIQRKRHSAPH